MSKQFNADWHRYKMQYHLALSANDKEIFAAGWKAADEGHKDKRDELIADLAATLASAAQETCSHDADVLRARVAAALKEAKQCS